MKKILLNGVDGNFGGKAAGILLAMSGMHPCLELDKSIHALRIPQYCHNNKNFGGLL